MPYYPDFEHAHGNCAIRTKYSRNKIGCKRHLLINYGNLFTFENNAYRCCKNLRRMKSLFQRAVGGEYVLLCAKHYWKAQYRTADTCVVR